MTRRFPAWLPIWLPIWLLVGLAVSPPRAAAAEQGGDADNGAVRSSLGSFVDAWSARVVQSQADQPSWQVPIGSPSPLLVERVRFDTALQQVRTGSDLASYGTGSSVSLIPQRTTELAFGMPAFVVRHSDGAAPQSGWGDLPVLTAKERLASAGNQSGDYAVTAALSVVAPTGERRLSARTYQVAPALYAGKGWRQFDVQAAVTLSVPTNGAAAVGSTLGDSVVLQYHLPYALWPEVGWSQTHWLSGARAGATQGFVTAGLIAGPYAIGRRSGISLGIGYQVAATPGYQTRPTTVPTYSRALLTTVRLGF